MGKILGLISNQFFSKAAPVQLKLGIGLCALKYVDISIAVSLQQSAAAAGCFRQVDVIIQHAEQRCFLQFQNLELSLLQLKQSVLEALVICIELLHLSHRLV